jgi:biotin transport system substrate-specific component
MTTHAAVITTRIAHRSRVSAVTLVVGFAVLTALLAQVRIPLWFTPVPITGQTFAVLLAGAALGSRLGVASQALYVAVGAVGVPVYTGWSRGWGYFTGATGGYLLGFVVAAFVVGRLAERRQDRTVTTAIPAFLTGTVVIYVFGVAWLARSLGIDAIRAMELGLVPFVIGDLLKIVLAGVTLPVAWRLTGRDTPPRGRGSAEPTR